MSYLIQLPGTLMTWYRIHKSAKLSGVKTSTLWAMLKSAPKQQNYIKAVNLGGLNNIGMYLHSIDKNHRNTFSISKIQPAQDAWREYNFIRWNETQRLDLCPAGHSITEIGNGNFAIICTDFLKKPRAYSPCRIHALHQRLAVASSQRSHLGSDDDLIKAVAPNTPIKNVLRGLVSEKKSDKVNSWCIKFIDERSSLFGDIERPVRGLFSYISQNWEILTEPASLVHGDFKSQNILEDNTGRYRLIDLQYYLPGQPMWDLSFYYSKYDSGFNDAWRDFEENGYYNDQQRLLFVFFYVIASSINVKAKRREYVLSTKILPALSILESTIHAEYL